METTKKLIPGVTVTLSGEQYVIPPLNFAGAKAVEADLASIAGAVAGEADVKNMLTKPVLEAMARVVCVALQRNYPDMTPEQVEDIMEVPTMGAVIRAIFEVSGLNKPGEPMASA